LAEIVMLVPLLEAVFRVGMEEYRSSPRASHATSAFGDNINLFVPSER
jgi:hypothetical protein